MKYEIAGFSQEYATTLKKKVMVKRNGIEYEKEIGIDIIDLFILRWFVDFYPNMKKIVVKGKEYAWLTHKKMIGDLPLLNISRRACIDRMQKLVEFGLLDYQLLKDGGTFSLYSFGENYINLVRSNDIGVCSQTTQGCTFKQHRGVRSNNIGVYVQTYNKDTSIKDTSIKNTSTNINNMSKKEFEEEFSILWGQYPNKKGKDKALTEYIKARKNGIEFGTIETGLMNYLKEIKIKETPKSYIKHGSTWFKNRCWDDEYQTVPEQNNATPIRDGSEYSEYD